MPRTHVAADRLPQTGPLALPAGYRVFATVDAPTEADARWVVECGLPEWAVCEARLLANGLYEVIGPRVTR
jgi:hypothetical protein